MVEPERLSFSNSGRPTEAPRQLPNLQQAQQQPRTFQASKDWNWFQTSQTSPWDPNPTCPFSSDVGYVQRPSVYHLNDHQFRRRDGGQNKMRNRKNRKEPEFSHFCDTCDRGFKSENKYNEHIAQHIKCPFEDCEYSAHEKLVKIHWKNSHAAGSKRIKLDTPEEIAKWREERRRNYPTQCNIEKKMKLIKAKEMRGDVLETSQFRHFKSCGKRHSRNCNRACVHTQKGHAYGGHQHIRPGTEMLEQASPLTCSSYNVDPLGALATSDPDSEKEEPVIVVAPKNMTSALGSLMASYGETVTESDEEPEDSTNLASEENKALLVTHSNPRQDTAPKLERRQTTEESVLSHQIQHPQSDSHPQKSRRRGRQHNEPWNRAQKCGPTLLEMLLAPDIRYERNVVLQCLRYMIHKEFFGLAYQDSKLLQPHVKCKSSVSGIDVMKVAKLKISLKSTVISSLFKST